MRAPNSSRRRRQLVDGALYPFIFSQTLSEKWDMPTGIDHRAGAGGVVGAKEAPDDCGLFAAAIHQPVNPH